MKFRPIVIITLLLLLGVQPAFSGFDSHVDTESCELSVLVDVASIDDGCDAVEFNANALSNACDHCGDCCHCHSYVFISTPNFFTAAQNATPMLPVSQFIEYLPPLRKNLYRPPIV